MTNNVAVIPGGLPSVLQPLDKCINKPFKAKPRMLYETWVVKRPVHVYPIWKEESTELRNGVDLD